MQIVPPDQWSAPDGEVDAVDAGERKVWTGFCSVEVPPSPKSQRQPYAHSDDASVKRTTSGAVPFVRSAVKFGSA